MPSKNNQLDPRYIFAEKLPVVSLFPIKPIVLDEFQEKMKKFLIETPFNEINQINLTSISLTHQDPYEGVGSIYSKADEKWITKESQYKYFIRRFEKTFLHEIYLKISQISPLPIGRVRLMKLNPGATYSLHRDNSIRYHLAIKTNPQSFLRFKDKGLQHIPADGKVYVTNTLLEHTAVNNGADERIHLVFSTAWVPDAEEKLKKFYQIEKS